eukprot:1159483-Pelagomonas_calceolata.AAC.15
MPLTQQAFIRCPCQDMRAARSLPSPTEHLHSPLHLFHAQFPAPCALSASLCCAPLVAGMQVVKVLCKSALCCRTLQTAGAEAVLKSILARATQVDRRAGSAGKDEHANGSSPAISGDKDNSNIRQIAPEGEHPAQVGWGAPCVGWIVIGQNFKH